MKKLFIFLFTILSLASFAQTLVRMSATATGTDTYSTTFNPTVSGFNQSTIYVLPFTNANTSGTVTIDPDAGGTGSAVSIKGADGNDLDVGAIVAGGVYEFKFNGTVLRMLGAWESGSGGAAAPGVTGNVPYKSNGDGFQAEVAFTYDSATNTLDADIITVNDDAYAVGWDGSVQIPTKNSIYDKIQSVAFGPSGIVVRTETATHDLDATDLATINDNKRLIIHLNSASAITLEIPLNVNVAFPINTIIEWFNLGAGQITFDPLSTVIMLSPANADKSYAQYSSGFIRKTATDTWVLGGDITP